MIDFIKKNPGILFSLLLIVLTPTFIFLNIFFIVSSFQNYIDDNLHSRATLTKVVFEILARETINEPKVLQKKIEKITEDQRVINIQIIIPEQNALKIVAAKNREDIGKIIPKDSISHQTKYFTYPEEQNNIRAWHIVDSFYNKEGQKVGFVSLVFSLEEADALIYYITWKSYLILIITVLIILVLIIYHIKLFKCISLYNQIKKTNKMKDDFIKIATHELQSPIINIRGHIKVLEEEIIESLTGEQKELFRRTKVSAKNLSNLLQDMLEVSKTEQRVLDFTPQKIYPQDIIVEIVQGLKIKEKQQNINLFLGVKKDHYFIQANSNRFRQVLTNLIKNAIKYAPNGKVAIRIKIDEIKKKYIIEVEDTGIGISEESQKKIFEKFYRVKTKETENIPGIGLGLWISKNFCKAMKGNIFIESAPGIGTKFTVIFPLVKGKK